MWEPPRASLSAPTDAALGDGALAGGVGPVTFTGLPGAWASASVRVPASARGLLRAQMRYMSRRRVALYRKASPHALGTTARFPSALACSAQLTAAVAAAVRRELSALAATHLQPHLQSSIGAALTQALPPYLSAALPQLLPAAFPSLQPLIEPLVASAVQSALQQVPGLPSQQQQQHQSGVAGATAGLSTPGSAAPADASAAAACKAAAQMSQMGVAGAREDAASLATTGLPPDLMAALAAQGGQASQAQLQAMAAGLAQRQGQGSRTVSHDAISAADVQHSLAQARLLSVGRTVSNLSGPSPPPSLPQSRAVSEVLDPSDLGSEQAVSTMLAAGELDLGMQVADAMGHGQRRNSYSTSAAGQLLRQVSNSGMTAGSSGSSLSGAGMTGGVRPLASQSTPLPGMGMGAGSGSGLAAAVAAGRGGPQPRMSMPSLLQQQPAQAQLAGLANLLQQQQQQQHNHHLQQQQQQQLHHHHHQQQQQQFHHQHHQLAGLHMGALGSSGRSLSPSASSSLLAQQAAALSSSLHGSTSGGLSPGRMSPASSPMATAHGLNVPLPSAGGGSMPALAQDAYLSLVQASPQVAQELLSLVTQYQSDPAQTQHLLWVIFAELRAVALECPEVALALLRTLARQQGLALPTDIDQRVMGRMLQLMRHGPSGRQLCIVGLEQWADGLGRITKKTAYLDTILHNNQMTHKKLWAEAGEAVHQIDMRLPRQLLNEVPVPGLLMLSGELTAAAATLPELQPRRWPDDAVWAIRQLYILACVSTTLPMAAAADQGIAAAAASAEPLPAALELFASDVKDLLTQVASDVAATNAAIRTGMPMPIVTPTPSIGRFASLVVSIGPGGGMSGGPGGRGMGLGMSSKTPSLTPLEDSGLQYMTFAPRLFEVLRRAQLRYFRAYMGAVMPGVYSAPVEALLLACPQDLLLPQYAEVVSAVAQLLAACALSSSDFDPWFYDDLYRCIDHFGMPEAVRRLRSGLLPDSPLRTFTHKNKALSHIIKGMGPPM